MKQKILPFVVALAMLATACKGKKDNAANTETTTTTQAPTTSTAPVEVAGDEELRKGVKDATKDFPDVQATVSNGEVTLTGSVQRDRLPTLMQSIQSLHPKKVNNQLNVQP
ncbi:MAG TPA: BON domain-containing protein [Flavisolibacter sp.]|nr:BON domain-containing protein [Flavisolibacter sp.]